MRLFVTTYADIDDDPYLAATFHTSDLETVFVDTAAGYNDNPTVSSWAATVLSGLGKQLDVAGFPDHPSDDVKVLPLWLLAHRTRWLIIPDPQLIARRQRRQLLPILAAGGCDLLLVVRPRRVTEVMAEMSGDNPTAVAWTDLDELLARRPRRVTRPRSSRHPTPTSDWTTFRWDARRSLDDSTFADFDRKYTDAYHATMQHLTAQPGPKNRSRQQTRRWLAQLTEPLDNVDDMLTVVRAAQAAHFRCGLNLRIDPRQLVRILNDTHDARLGDDDWTMLRAYRDPRRAAVCALRAAGMSVDQIGGLTLGQGASLLAPESDAIDERAHPFVRAAMLDRRADLADDTAPLIDAKPIWISAAINRASVELGVRISTGARRKASSTLGFWQYRDGFLIQGITS